MTEETTEVTETVEATAEAQQDAQPVPKPDDSDGGDEYSNAMYDAYDRAMKAIEDEDNPPEDKPDEPEAKATEDEKDATKEDATEDGEKAEDKGAAAPTDIPAALKKVWADLSEDARSAIVDHTHKVNKKAADAGQEVKRMEGVRPVHDALVEMADEVPGLKDRPISEVVREVKDLARISAAMNKDPLRAVMGVIQQHGLGQAIVQHLSGQQPQQAASAERLVATMQQHIQHLEKQLQQVSDPEHLRRNMATVSAQDVLTEFQESADRWDDVEDIMPNIIRVVQSDNPGLPARDVLEKAYNRALRVYDTDEEKPAPATPDPDRIEAAKKATQINVNGTGNGKGRELTEREMMLAAYDREMRA